MNKIFIPKENVSDNTAKVTALFFQDKELVSKGDIVLSVETSKADMDIETEFDGYILFLTKEGENCPINEVIALVFDTVDQLENYKEEKSNSLEVKKNNLSNGKLSISKSAQRLIDEHNINIENFKDELITADTVRALINKNRQLKKNAEFKDNDVVLIGTGGATEMVVEAIKKEKKLNIVGFIDDFSKSTVFGELPIFGKTDSIDHLIDKGLKNLVLAYGFMGFLDNRKSVFESFAGKIDFPNIIDPTSNVEGSVILGEGNIVLANAYLGPKVKLGNINIVNTASVISHETEIKDGNHFTPSSTIAGQVKIGSLNTFGMNCSVLMKTVIGDNVVISNNVATNSDVESNSIIKLKDS